MNAQDQELMDNGLPREVVLSIDAKFKEYEHIANEWNKKAYDIVVSDESQVELMQQAREGRLLLKTKRVEIEKTRKRLKEQSLLEGRFIDSLAKRLFEIIQPAEDHLLSQEMYAETQERLRKAKIKAERLEILNPFLQFVDLSAFDLSTMSDVAFTTIKNGAEVSFNLHLEQQEKLRITQEELQAKVKLYAERKMKLASYSFYATAEDTLHYDTDHEQFLNILQRLQNRKQQDDEQKELLAKQNAELQKQVLKSEKKVTVLTKKSLEFEAIAKSNVEYVKSIEVIKKEHTDMKIVLETALNFIIPDQLRKLIEKTLKF